MRPAAGCWSAPMSTPAVLARAADFSIVTMPGVFTPTEAFLAIRPGASALKFFPASVLGAKGIAAIGAVLPKDIVVGVVGGISEADFADLCQDRRPHLRPGLQPLQAGHERGRSR